MGNPTIAAIEDALIAAIRQADALAYVPDPQVQTLSLRGVDFDQEAIIVIPPAVLVAYVGGGYEPHDNTLHKHVVRHRFLLIAVAENLRGNRQAKEGDELGTPGAYGILDDLADLFAGRRIEFAGARRTYCRLAGTSFEGINPNGHFAYGLEIEVHGVWDNIQ